MRSQTKRGALSAGVKEIPSPSTAVLACDSLIFVKENQHSKKKKKKKPTAAQYFLMESSANYKASPNVMYFHDSRRDMRFQDISIIFTRVRTFKTGLYQDIKSIEHQSSVSVLWSYLYNYSPIEGSL